MPVDRRERLEKHQALTDFCHTSLRLVKGLTANALRLKFGADTTGRVERELEALAASGLVNRPEAGTKDGWSLTAEGRVLANLVFEKLTFLKDDLSNA